ncbi:hypothetical protein KAU11_11260 [Candidatus Babeliales bacterium]|nr:hypothetical protein [Candidatus Babeliales bacterium]
MPEKVKEKINNSRLSVEDKAQLIAEIQNIIKKVEEQNKALGKIIKETKKV